MKLLLILVVVAKIHCNDLLAGHRTDGKIIFDKNVEAAPAIWRQVNNITVNATDGEHISRIVVTDLRDAKDADVNIMKGNIGDNSVTLEFKSPSALRGYNFHVEVYSLPNELKDKVNVPENTPGIKIDAPRTNLADVAPKSPESNSDKSTFRRDTENRDEQQLNTTEHPRNLFASSTEITKTTEISKAPGNYERVARSNEEYEPTVYENPISTGNVPKIYENPTGYNSGTFKPITDSNVNNPSETGYSNAYPNQFNTFETKVIENDTSSYNNPANVNPFGREALENTEDEAEINEKSQNKGINLENRNIPRIARESVSTTESNQTEEKVNPTIFGRIKTDQIEVKVNDNYSKNSDLEAKKEEYKREASSTEKPGTSTFSYSNPIGNEETLFNDKVSSDGINTKITPDPTNPNKDRTARDIDLTTEKYDKFNNPTVFGRTFNDNKNNNKSITEEGQVTTEIGSRTSTSQKNKEINRRDTKEDKIMENTPYVNTKISETDNKGKSTEIPFQPSSVQTTLF